MMRLLIQRGELESEFEKSVGVLVLLPLRANPFVGRIRTFCDMILLWELAKNLPQFLATSPGSVAEWQTQRT
jgi:hypothetical protein